MECRRDNNHRAPVISSVRRAWVVVLYLPLLVIGCPSLGNAQSVTVLCYNVKGTFGDQERATYHAERIATVIKLATPRAPDLVVLQEIEEEELLSEIVSDYLIGSGYGYVATSPPVGGDLRVALISRYPIRALRYHSVYRTGYPALRGVLEAEVLIEGETLWLFMVHLKSKRGGARETEALRIAVVEALQWRMYTLLSADPSAALMVAGDFNESPDEYQRVAHQYPTALVSVRFKSVVGADRWYQPLFISSESIENSLVGESVVLYSPWGDSEHEGSYWYNQQWEAIDNILLSSALLHSAPLRYADFSAVTKGDILTSAGTPNHYYSDHLPLLLELTVR